MNAYFDLLLSLTYLFMWITIFSIPTYLIFASYGAIYGESMGIVTQFSLGDMGGANTQCIGIQWYTSTMIYTCDTGVLTSYVYGIIPNTEDVVTYCMPGEQAADGTWSPFDSSCDSYLDTTTIDSAISDQCVGKSSCTI
jgi:hypothetical protein